MLSSPLCLGTGTVLVMSGGGAAGYLAYLQLRHGVSGRTLLSTSDTLAILATGILFLVTTIDDSETQPLSPRALGSCDYGRVITTAALFLVPLINAFVSALVQTYECYGEACGAPRGAGSGTTRRIGVGLVAQWAVPAVATLALLFSDIHVRLPTARNEECFASSGILLATRVRHNCTRQQSNSVYALMTDVELPLKNNDDLIRQHIEENRNSTIITDLTDSIVKNIYDIVRESLNSSKQLDGRNSYSPQFLHRHRRDTQGKESHEYENGTHEESESDSLDYEVTSYPTGITQTQSNTQDSMTAVDKQEANTGSTPQATQKPISHSTPTTNFTYILLPNHIDTIPTFDDVATCVTQCYLSGQFLKTHLFVILFTCYFVPLAATGILYFMIRQRLVMDRQGEDEHARHTKDGEQQDQTTSNNCSDRLAKTANTLRQFILISVTLWTPSLVDTLLRVWFCTSLPDALSTLLFELAQLHGLVRNVLDIKLARTDLTSGNTLSKGVLQRVMIHPASDRDTTTPASSDKSDSTQVKQTPSISTLS